MVIAVTAGALIITACVVGLAPSVWSALHAHDEVPVKLPAFSGLATRTQILDVNNRQIGVFEFENSQPVSISDIPDHVDYLSFRPSHGVMKNGWVNPTIAPK